MKFHFFLKKKSNSIQQYHLQIKQHGVNDGDDGCDVDALDLQTH